MNAANDAAIEAHEEIALVAFIGREELGLVALVVAGLMGVTAERGGRIHHPEIQESS